MIWGEDDIALSKATTYGTDRFVSNLTLRYLPGVSHWVQQDGRDAVNAMLEEFLATESAIKNLPLMNTDRSTDTH
jgi:pimeloyl-ACP methyl ester carboxylesterase